MKKFCELPEDLVIEILSRLSAKSLLRLKCVCKSWYSLIKSPCFVTRHLQQTSGDNHRTGLLIIHRPMSTDKIKLSWFCNDTFDKPVELKIPFERMPRYQNEIAGPCNGLFCVYDFLSHHPPFLWNPATREVKDLPLPSAPPHHMRSAFCNCGFGFDPKTNDYKVVRLLQYPLQFQSRCIELYSLSTDKWTKIDTVLQVTIVDSPSMCMNGVHHWWARNEYDIFILSFDIGDQSFQTTPLGDQMFLFNQKNAHPIVELPYQWGMLFTEWNKSLAVIVYRIGRCTEIWQMSEYGSNAIWSKQLTIAPVPAGERGLLAAWNITQEFIIGNYYDGMVVSCNPNTRTLKFLVPAATGTPNWSIRAVRYKDSLVSVNGTIASTSAKQRDKKFNSLLRTIIQNFSGLNCINVRSTNPN